MAMQGGRSVTALYSESVCVCVWRLLTQCVVVEGEVSQVSRVLRQSEQAPRVTVPHQATPGGVL